MGRRQQSQHTASSSSMVTKPRRQRASPARLVKLYKKLTPSQKTRIRTIGFGGLLQIACDTLPADFANWLMTDCYDADSSELVFPGRGRIVVNAESVCNVLGLPNEGDEVKYELDVDAINFIHEEYGIDEGTAPTIDSILERLKNNSTSNDDFLRSWLMIAVSTFLCPPTGLSISPRCYPAIVDLSSINKLNWCQFVVDQLKGTANKMGKRKSFKGCLLVLVIIYVESLVVDNVQILSTKPKIAAWSRQLLDCVIKLDTNRDGSFGKLKLKGSSYCTPQTSLFHMEDIRRFVSTKVPTGISDQKKSTLNIVVTQFCSSFIELLGTFLENVCASEAPATQREGTSKRSRAAQDNHFSECGPSSTHDHCRAKHSKLKQVVPDISQRQTRSMSTRVHVAEDESLCQESEDDLLSEENVDTDTDQDEEDFVCLDSEDENSNTDHDNASDDHGIGNLPPILEDEDGGIEKQDPPASFKEPKLDDATTAENQCNVQAAVDSSTRVEAAVDDIDDLVPLNIRLERLRALKLEDKKHGTSTCSEPKPLEIIPPEPKPKSTSQRMREKLMIPLGETHGASSCHLDFTPQRSTS